MNEKVIRSAIGGFRATGLWAQVALARGREFREQSGRPDRAGHKRASAIWAYAAENLIGAVGAKGAFERTNTGVRAVGRQVAIAAFAVRGEFHHGASPVGSGLAA